MREADVPAEQPQAKEDARIPRPDAHARRAGGAESTTHARPQAARRLTRPVRDRATFDALARTRAKRRGPVSVRVHASSSAHGPRVAYAVSRRVGGAVERNRVRRRLRAAVRVHADALDPRASYLFGAGREAMTMPFDALRRRVGELLRDGAP